MKTPIFNKPSPHRGGGINWTGPPRWQTRRRALQNRQLRRMAFFFAFFLVLVSSRRRRMACRFYPTPCEMNVKRSFKPTAEKTKNRRKT